jgi:Predicted membrane protein
MAVVIERRYSDAIHPMHATFVAGTIPLFLGATLCDLAYGRTFEIQWSNFASWLVVGGLIFTTLSILCALADLFRAHKRAPGIGVYFVLLLGLWVLGFFDALMHARDAWAMMPGGLVMSALTTVLACVVTWLAMRRPRIEGALA